MASSSDSQGAWFISTKSISTDNYVYSYRLKPDYSAEDNADSDQEFFDDDPITTMRFSRLESAVNHLSEYLPKCPHGFMIVTTKSLDTAVKFATICSPINVENMSLEK